MFTASESVVPYLFSDSGRDVIYLFFQRQNNLYYAAFNAANLRDSSDDGYGQQPITDPATGQPLTASDYVSIVAGPDGAAKPYLFWNTPKTLTQTAYLNACQIQLNNWDSNNNGNPKASIISGSINSKLTPTIYAPSAAYVDRGNSGQYFVIFHNQPGGDIHDKKNPKRLQGYMLGIKNCNALTQGNYDILYNVVSAGKRGNVGQNIYESSAPYACPASTSADIYILTSNNYIQVVNLDLTALTVGDQNLHNYIASPMQTTLPFRPVGQRSLSVSVVRTLVK
jgi:hypothetical protein